MYPSSGLTLLDRWQASTRKGYAQFEFEQPL